MRRNYLRERGQKRPIMGKIIRGEYRSRKYPGSVRFAHYCSKLRKAFDLAKRHRSRKEPAIRMFEALESHSCVFDEYPVNRGKLITILLDFATHHERWQSPPEEWRPEPDCLYAESQLRSFLCHVLMKYPVPRFFESVFHDRNWIATPEFQWCLHVGSGENLRTVSNLPFTLTKREMHLAMMAPSDLGVCEALFWGKFKAVDAPDWLARELLHTTWVHANARPARGPDKTDCKWLVDLTSFFVRTGLDQVRLVGPLVDYVSDQGRAKSFLKGRTLTSLIRDMENWHLEVARRHGYCPRYPKEIVTWDKAPGVYPKKWEADWNGMTDGEWILSELLSSEELAREGGRMHHCVGTYTERCKTGICSIWSLRHQTESGSTSHITIEVQKSNSRNRIAQARGKHNSKPVSELIPMVIQWANANQIEYGVLLR